MLKISPDKTVKATMSQQESSFVPRMHFLPFLSLHALVSLPITKMCEQTSHAIPPRGNRNASSSYLPPFILTTISARRPTGGSRHTLLATGPPTVISSSSKGECRHDSRMPADVAKRKKKRKFASLACGYLMARRKRRRSEEMVVWLQCPDCSYKSVSGGSSFGFSFLLFCKPVY